MSKIRGINKMLLPHSAGVLISTIYIYSVTRHTSTCNVRNCNLLKQTNKADVCYTNIFQLEEIK